MPLRFGYLAVLRVLAGRWIASARRERPDQMPVTGERRPGSSRASTPITTTPAGPTGHNGGTLLPGARIPLPRAPAPGFCAATGGLTREYAQAA